MIGILELLVPRGLDLNSKVKIVRHQNDRYDLIKLEREGHVQYHSR